LFPRRVAGRSSRRPGTGSKTLVMGSACVVGGPELPDHRDLDLTGVLQVVLELAGDLTGEVASLEVGDVARVDQHTDLASGLQGELLFDSRELECDPLETLQPLDVCLEGLTPGSGPCGGHVDGGL